MLRSRSGQEEVKGSLPQSHEVLIQTCDKRAAVPSIETPRKKHKSRIQKYYSCERRRNQTPEKYGKPRHFTKAMCQFYHLRRNTGDISPFPNAAKLESSAQISTRL